MQAKGKLFFHGLPYKCRCILFDEFENTCRVEELNRLLDYHPCRTEYKGTGSFPFLCELATLA